MMLSKSKELPAASGSFLRSLSNNLLSHPSSLLLVVILIPVFATSSTAQPATKQPGIRELPIIEKPVERPTSERVVIRSRPAQPTKGVLAVVLDPIANGKVVVKDQNGKVIVDSETGENGQAEFQLQRKKVYQVEASLPGYVAASSKTKPLGATEVMRLKLRPQFANIKLLGIPPGSKILIDENERATADKSGEVNINEIQPGDHQLLIRNLEYNDYDYKLSNLEAGVTYNLSVRMDKVAKLTIRCLPNANVMIDGAFHGRVEKNGTVQINYPLKEAVESTITVELLGYQSWSGRELLSPGQRTIIVKLDPIVTSTGFSDLFVNLNQWNAPSGWKVIRDGQDTKVEINEKQLGLLKEITYRDFEANFTVLLGEGKGATWAIRADKEGRNYYLFHISGPKSGALTPNRFYSYLVRDGGEPVEMAPPSPVIIDLTQPGTYTIAAIVKGHNIKHSITGNYSGETSDLGSCTDDTPTKERFLYGTFGFRSLSGEVFTVDELHLEPIKPN